MTPAKFTDVIVLPTVREHLAARGDRRLAYLACIATYSLVEYVARVEAGDGASKTAIKKAREDVGKAVRAVCAPAYEVVQGICNGTKHAGSDHGQFPFTPGDEMIVDLHQTYTFPIFPLGTKIVAAQIVPDHKPMVVDHAGKLWGIDHCVQEVLHAFVTTYPLHLGAVDLSFLNRQFRLTKMLTADSSPPE